MSSAMNIKPELITKTLPVSSIFYFVIFILGEVVKNIYACVTIIYL